jgi:hypothetical protein
MARNGRVIIAELKSASGNLTDDQQAWIEATGGYIWRPEQGYAGVVEKVLA